MKNIKEKTLFITIIVTLLIVLIGATYAYFTQMGETGTQTDVSVGTSKEDILTFEVGSDINIEVNQSTFASGKGNASSSTFGKAILKTANQENELKASYNLYLNIIRNGLSYTSSDNTPELLLKVTDSTGTELTSINGLNYKEVTDGLGNTVKGFDITTKTGLITILNNQEIVAQPTKTDTWNVEVILVNLDSDQSDNAGKNFFAKLQMNKDEYKVILADYIKSQYTTQGANGLYLHNGTITSDDGTVIDANDGSYRYAGGDYKLTNKAITTGLINYYCDGVKKKVGYICFSGLQYYTLQYDTSNTQYETYKEVLAKAVEDGYLSSDNVKNYVCFGSDEEICPSDNLYRVIGVFGDQVKLIKADYATSDMLGENGAFSEDTFTASIFSSYKGSLTTINRYYWNSIEYISTNTSSESSLNKNNMIFLNNKSTEQSNIIAEKTEHSINIWGESNLNRVNLNTNYIIYLNSQNSKWTNMIATTSWKVGGIYEDPAGFYGEFRYWEIYYIYQNEIVSPVERTTYSAKIGLMYASDYGYSTSPSEWDSFTYSTISNYGYAVNWMYAGVGDWTITRDYSSTLGAITVEDDGELTFYQIDDIPFCIRPTFYLNSNVTYNGGSGTSTDPYRVA